MSYTNPIPQVTTANKFRLTVLFTFEENAMPIQDAQKGITNTILNTIQENDGVIPASWIDYAD